MLSKAKKFDFILLSIAVFLIISATDLPATDVSGDVWGEWTSAGNPYNVIGDLRVPPESSLVIDPGCYVEFQGQYHLFADTASTLKVEGTDVDTVVFSAADTTSGWGGIRFLSADSSSFIKYSILKYGGVGSSIGRGGIYCHNSHLLVENCRFESSVATSGETIYISRYSTFEIRNNLFSDDSPSAKTAINVFGYSEGVIEYNIFEGYHDGFVLLIGDDCLIRENIFHNNYNCTVIFLDLGTILIEGNIIYDNGGMILWFFHTGGESIISRNLIYNNYYGAPVGPGIIGCDDSEVRLINNTITNNAGNHQAYLAGFYEEFWAQPATLTNNIIWGNDYEPGQIFEIDSNVDFSISYSDIQGNWGGGGNIDVDPLFVDTAGGDFHLLPDSPCIDAGDPASPLDPDGTIADMGALYFDQSTVIKLPDLLPRKMALFQNYPNPFNAGTVIRFELPHECLISIDIYDLLGRRVSSIIDGYYQRGRHEIAWDGRSPSGNELPTGVYLYRLKGDTFEQTRKMILLK